MVSAKKAGLPSIALECQRLLTENALSLKLRRGSHRVVALPLQAKDHLRRLACRPLVFERLKKRYLPKARLRAASASSGVAAPNPFKAVGEFTPEVPQTLSGLKVASYERLDKTMILYIAQTAMRETGQKMQRKFQAPRFPFGCVKNLP